MAAVERSISSVPDQEPQSLLEVIDVDAIIDVDSLDDEDIQSEQRRVAHEHAVARASQSTPIVVSDSDDEGISVTTTFSSNSLRRSAENSVYVRHTVRLMSPPAPPQDTSVPRVPRVPAHLADRTSLPMRRRAPPFPIPASGVVRPSSIPFSFEENIRSVARNDVDVDRDFALPVAAPPSHHQPSMGFGGAILAWNRETVEEDRRSRRQAREERSQRRRTFRLPSITVNYFAHALDRLSYGDPFAHEDMEESMASVFGEAEGGFSVLFPPALFDQRRAIRRQDPDYVPSFTHPGKPALDFTFDFAPQELSASHDSPSHVIVLDDSLGSSSAPSSSSLSSAVDNPVLVCAKCLKPLLLGGLQSAEERSQRRLWGLKCGHMLDGECVEELMKPVGPQMTDAVVDSKGKGKAKATEELSAEQSSVYVSLPKRTRFDKSESNDDHLEAFGAVGSNSMRSRLRPRRQASHSMVSQPSSTSLPCPSRALARRAQGGTRSKGKGKGKAHEPVIEAEHEWVCPVQGCGRVHKSVRIDGKWSMDSQAGAIPVFV